MNKQEVLECLKVLKDILVHLDNADEFDNTLYKATREKIIELYKLI